MEETFTTRRARHWQRSSQALQRTGRLLPREMIAVTAYVSNPNSIAFTPHRMLAFSKAIRLNTTTKQRVPTAVELSKLGTGSLRRKSTHCAPYPPTTRHQPHQLQSGKLRVEKKLATHENFCACQANEEKLKKQNMSVFHVLVSHISTASKEKLVDVIILWSPVGFLYRLWFDLTRSDPQARAPCKLQHPRGFANGFRAHTTVTHYRSCHNVVDTAH